ncbi:hypothetical protein [Pseudomonas chlororaphis]|uniref:hypothetical protein n=1 Tax=Pseudomonas chlororaphis TaxID=587753 RepID=UPI0004708D80|nr:hypothetical protein [Pseudomonas chlororaphis]
MNYFESLGAYYGEKKIKDLLEDLKITETPTLPRGDADTYLLKEEAGIELTLSDSESIKDPKREYPDGALVLTNVRYYGKEMQGFSIFQGELPYGIQFGQEKKEIISMLGEPEWKNSDESRLRWIRGNHRVHVTLNDANRAIIVSVGLPF